MKERAVARPINPSKRTPLGRPLGNLMTPLIFR